MNWFINGAAAANKLFHEDFDAPAVIMPLAPEAAVVPEPDVDVAAERQAAWDAGFAAGRKADQSERAMYAQGALRIIAEELKTARADLLSQADRTADELARFMLAALGQVLPTLCARHGAAEINAVAAEILPALVGEPRVRVQVPSERVAELRSALAGMDDTDHIELAGVPGLGPSDIAVRWQHGLARRDAQAIWESILSILAPHGIAPLPAGPVEPIKEPELVE